MKTKITLFFIFFLAQAMHLSAQSSAHPTIRSFALRFEDGDTTAVSASMDSVVVILYRISLTDTLTTKKVHVRISSGNTSSGNLLSVSFDINGSPVVNNQGKIVFIREKDLLTIRTITAQQMADNNFEVYTENYQGGMSPVLNWKKQ